MPCNSADYDGYGYGYGEGIGGNDYGEHDGYGYGEGIGRGPTMVRAAAMSTMPVQVPLHAVPPTGIAGIFEQVPPVALIAGAGLLALLLLRR